MEKRTFELLGDGGIFEGKSPRQAALKAASAVAKAGKKTKILLRERGSPTGRVHEFKGTKVPLTAKERAALPDHDGRSMIEFKPKVEKVKVIHDAEKKRAHEAKLREARK